MNTIKGENLMIFVKQDDLLGNGSQQMMYFGLAISCELDVNVDAFETTSKDSGSWKTSKPGMKSWTMSTENLYSPHADKLLALQISRIPIRLYWLSTTNIENANVAEHTPSLTVDGETYMQYSGEAWINNYHANSPNNDAANYTVNFTGTGPLSPDNKLPGAAVGVDRANLSLEDGESAQVIASGFTGTLTATCSYTGVTCNVGTGGVITVAVASGATPGATHITVADSGTSTACYVSLIIN